MQELRNQKKHKTSIILIGISAEHKESTYQIVLTDANELSFIDFYKIQI